MPVVPIAEKRPPGGAKAEEVALSERFDIVCPSPSNCPLK